MDLRVTAVVQQQEWKESDSCGAAVRMALVVAASNTHTRTPVTMAAMNVPRREKTTMAPKLLKKGFWQHRDGGKRKSGSRVAAKHRSA